MGWKGHKGPSRPCILKVSFGQLLKSAVADLTGESNAILISAIWGFSIVLFQGWEMG